MASSFAALCFRTSSFVARIVANREVSVDNASLAAFSFSAAASIAPASASSSHFFTSCSMTFAIQCASSAARLRSLAILSAATIAASAWFACSLAATLARRARRLASPDATGIRRVPKPRAASADA